MTTDDTAVETFQLCRQFDDLRAVDNLDLRVERGTLYGFLGRNGAGKSTTIKMLTGLLAPSSGSIRMLGNNPLDPDQAIDVKRRVGVVPEDLALYDLLTGRENLTFVGRMYRVDRDVAQDRIDELFALLELGADAGEEKRLVIDYSHGMKKKLALAAALIANPVLLFLNLFANVFGQDGNGFRAVVLAGVPPTQLLFGKNLALLPYTLAIGALIIAVLQWIHPLPATHVLANIAQLLVLHLLGCMLGNSFSIRAPWPMSATSMGMRNATAASFLASFLILLLLFAFIAPLWIPIRLEMRLAEGGSSLPLYLIFSVLELTVVGFVYHRLLKSKGRLLGTRMESILARVTQPVD